MTWFVDKEKRTLLQLEIFYILSCFINNTWKFVIALVIISYSTEDKISEMFYVSNQFNLRMCQKVSSQFEDVECSLMLKSIYDALKKKKKSDICFSFLLDFCSVNRVAIFY